MTEYFFITESGEVDTRNVIEVVGMSRGMNKLRVSAWNGQEKQLWKWTGDGSLENKYSKLVIDVRREETKEGTDVIIWSKMGNMNQKWQIENQMIRSRTGNDLNVTKLVNGFLGVWHTGDHRDNVECVRALSSQ